MTTYARIVSGCAVDITTVNPATLFHKDVAAEFIEVPDDTTTGDRLNDNGTWTKYVAPVTVIEPVKPPIVTPPQFKMLMLPDLPQIRGLIGTDATVAAFMSIVDDPRLTEVDLSLQSVQNGIKYCLMKIGRTEQQTSDRMAQILTGVLT